MPGLSPAERYLAASSRTKYKQLERFKETQKFELDPFQVSSCQAVEAGRGVLVAAPTGAGKTVVAEFAVYLALALPKTKVFYTTPMKALSNQKFHDLVSAHGVDQIGLLTGDTSINPEARIVVMTTEVLRNMLYASSALLENLGYVVMDEVHYLADRFRGAVWEEVIIHLPDSVQLVSLSATVSNAEEFGAWLQTVRGDTDVIVSEDRPVPLHQHMMFAHKLLPLFDSSGGSAKVNPEVLKTSTLIGRGAIAGARNHRRRPTKTRQFDRGYRVFRSDVVSLLRDENLLPAIYFIFSRAGCDQAVSQVLKRNLSLTSELERREILDLVEAKLHRLEDEDLGAIGYDSWLDGVLRGVAAHHAGMVPVFKEIIEELFQLRLVKVVFATDTLALGINMPAQTVVIEKLEKFNGEARVPITPGEYTQLTGRAGRRGIDTEGHSVVIWQPGVNPQSAASLASRRSFPLRSSFRPTYNMAVNLIDQFGLVSTRRILETSFAQFQADRNVVELNRNLRDQESSLKGYAEAMVCHLGDFSGYALLRHQLSEIERKLQPAREPLRTDLKVKALGLRTDLARHPCHECPERESHARWAGRWKLLERDIGKLRARISRRTGAISGTFDRVTALLADVGYLEPQGDELVLTDHGKLLKSIFAEKDLLIAECLRRQAWHSLNPSELAAVVSAVVYEARRDDEPMGPGRLAKGNFSHALERTQSFQEQLRLAENSVGLPSSQELSSTIAPAVHQWAGGDSLDQVLGGEAIQVGDFVRWCKQIVDILDQIISVGSGGLQQCAKEAKAGVYRGIVAYSGVV